MKIGLTSPVTGGRKIQARLARLRITKDVPLEYDYEAFGAEYKTVEGEYYDDRLIGGVDQEAKFRLQLKAGKAFLQTWLEDREGITCGAYYVYIRRLS